MTTAPTLTELYNGISADLKSQFGITSENDLKRVLTALAMSNAGMLKLFYLALLDVQKNIFPDQADPENMGGTLERFGRVKLGRDPYPATQGEFQLTVTGVSGGYLPVGTVFVNKTTGNYYTATESLSLAGTSGTIKVSSNNSGAAYNLSVGDIIFTVNTIINVNSQTTVASVTTLGVDAEDIEEYRGLVIQAFRLEPNGGSASDYVYWALDVAGIRTVYPYTTKGLSGSAIIYVEALPSISTDGRGTAPQALIDALWKTDRTGVYEMDPDNTLSDYERGRRQLGLSDITLLSITPLPVVITISNLRSKTQTVKDSITSALISLLYAKRPYVAGVGDINNRQDTLYFKDIVSSLDNVLDSSNVYDDVTATVNGQNIPFQFLDGNIPYLSTVIYA